MGVCFLKIDMDTSHTNLFKSPGRIRKGWILNLGGSFFLAVLILLSLGWFSILAVETEIKSYLNDQLKMSLPRAIKMLKVWAKDIELDAQTIAENGVVRDLLFAINKRIDKNSGNQLQAPTTRTPR